MVAKTVLRIDGMKCDHCVRAVSLALEQVPGVQKAVVSLVNRTASVEHEQGSAKVTELIGAVEEEGYGARN